MTVASSSPTVGVVANPASGRDIRRLVARASVFPTAEKANMVVRMLTAFGSVGVERVLLSTDLGGISAGVLRALKSRVEGVDPPWPQLHFVDDDPITGTGEDTTLTVRRMIAAGAEVIVCLGGDGTARLAAAACGEVPLLALSTGTNNAFPVMREATIAGLAAGLVATHAVPEPVALRRDLALEVRTDARREIALVDVCVAAARHIGSRALWDPAGLRTLICTFAEPDAIGLSSIAGLLCPSPRRQASGVLLELAAPESAPVVVRAPIAPGLVLPVGVRSWRELQPGDEVAVTDAGVIALDGEREIELRPRDRATVSLTTHGPRAIDIPAVMAHAACEGLLTTGTPDLTSSIRKRKGAPR
ncbi:ATP-NAD kinase [Calidifontibacter sp. DB0510]|uniref:ATP-NAD kinase n=1 Tax=Metallococcus carri TaxID=1656884 RepID=A0A967B2U1_9MICO|nr:NAD(+)/NADH kinase [Metallococcus carri]NHN56360.1 ATP-NAD kinase [Metallococcus carri]NOP35984.1 ATP-NAD kinase [Calidifontibacter sp. DB2511S]